MRIGKRLAPHDVAFEYEALTHLAKRGIPVARILKTKTGATEITVDGQAAVLFSFLEGQHIDVDQDHLPTRAQCYEAGAALGRLAIAGRTFAPSTPRTRTIFAELERALALEETFAAKFEGGATFITQVKDALAFGKTQHETVGLIHNDYRPSNVFFDIDGTVTGILDFDWSCIGPLVKDVALAAVEWSFPDGATEANPTIFDAFLEGYNATANERVEKDDRFYSWIRFATISDAATYFCDLAEDPGSTKRIIKSYMYRKYLSFLNT